MEIRPILSAMLRSRTGAVLVALQVAITLAVLCNAGFIVSQRLATMDRPTGYDADNALTVQVLATDRGNDGSAAIAADLRALRAMPGVVAAGVTPQLPLSGGGLGWSFARTADANDPTSTGASLVLTDEAGLDAFGLELTAGRWFRPEEVGTLASFDSLAGASVPTVVITQALADRLFPAGDALGAGIYDGLTGRASVIIGIVRRAQGYFLHSESVEMTAFWPLLLTHNGGQQYVLRVKPEARAEVARDVAQVLSGVDPARIVRHVQTLAEVRDETYGNDRAMAVTLLAVMVLLVVVTVLGIFGLMSFNVSRRRKQIGTRRALGARRRDIVRHFLLESWLITSLGALLGILLAIALSVWLVHAFELPKLDWRFLPAGIIGLWAIGQLAAFGPARRAAGIEPAIATRSV